jgi:hypothetical protein
MQFIWKREVEILDLNDQMPLFSVDIEEEIGNIL